MIDQYFCRKSRVDFVVGKTVFVANYFGLFAVFSRDCSIKLTTSEQMLELLQTKDRGWQLFSPKRY